MSNQNGFVAGTLVHTDKGLVPIQNIKIGDRVLSRSGKDPNAPNEYKRVLNTFKSKEKEELFYASYAVKDIDGQYRSKYIFCTEDQPFWVEDFGDAMGLDDYTEYKDMGWHPSQEINGALGHALETYTGIPLISGDFGHEKTISCTADPLVVMLYSDSLYCRLDLRSEKPIVISGGGIKLGSSPLANSMASTQAKRILPDDENDPEVQFFAKLKPTFESYCTDVYNLEVEDYHTYFVEDEGVWVHE